MPGYPLNALGPQDFERVVQSLLKAVIGAGRITFGDGRDGGREATFSRKRSLPLDH
jgi:hypothetical protein